jgi:hypothetical protein
MIKYYHLEHGGGKLTEITEGEYEFRLSRSAYAADRSATFLQPGRGFESVHGACFVVEVGNAS